MHNFILDFFSPCNYFLLWTGVTSSTKFSCVVVGFFVKKTSHNSQVNNTGMHEKGFFPMIAISTPSYKLGAKKGFFVKKSFPDTFSCLFTQPE